MYAVEDGISHPKPVVRAVFMPFAGDFSGSSDPAITKIKGVTMLQFLHAVQDIPADGDPIALAIVLVALGAFAVWAIVTRKKADAPEAPVEAVQEAPAAEAPGSAGSVKLYNVEPKTAAMLMAIVADKTGKPLNELRFISVKEVE